MKKHVVINVLAIPVDVVDNRLNSLIKALYRCSLLRKTQDESISMN